MTTETYFDPFTATLMALWGLIERQPDINRLVKVRNRIKLFEGSTKPEKERHTDSDLPELTIEPAGGEVQMAVDSDCARVTQRFRLGLVTGDLRVHKIFFPLKWAMIKALASAHHQNLGLDYVRNVILEDGLDMKNTDIHPGFSTGLDVVIEMYFDRSKLRS